MEKLHHSWNQRRTNEVTPKTFAITRGGQGATLVNPSFFEADATFKCLNKLHLVLTRDSFFQDPPNSKIKKEMLFIADNESSDLSSHQVM